MTEDKSKYELTLDFVMILGKYFEENKDFINVMKVCKKYEELVEMYHFNPISNISLFENIQTQHFYNQEDINNKKNGLYKYIYWIVTNADEVINYLKNKINNIENENKEYKNISIDKNIQEKDIVFIKKYYPNINIKEFDFKNSNCDINTLPDINNLIIKNLPNDTACLIGNTTNKFSFVIKEGITSIGKYCFFNCTALTNIELPTTLIEINDCSFPNTGLTTIIIPEGITRIGTSAFSNCKQLTNIILPSSLIELGNYVFRNTKITKINIPEGITKITHGCFDNCYELTNIELPSSLIELDNFALSCTKLKTIIIPNNVKYIGDRCFYDCYYLTNVTLPSSLIELGDDTFYNTSITTITIPENVTKIGCGCFENCDELTSITLPSSLNCDIYDLYFKTNIKKINTY